MKRQQCYIVGVTYAVCLFMSCKNNTDTGSVQHKTVDTVSGISSRLSNTDTIVQLAKISTAMIDSIRTIPLSGNAESDFAAIMMTHENAAVQMYQVVASGAADSVLKRLARQTAARASDYLNLLQPYYAPPKDTATSWIRNKAIRLFDSLAVNGLPMHGAYLDLDFSTMMIHHHNSGITLCRFFIERGNHQVLRGVAKQIIAANTADIAALKRWKSSRYPDAHW